MANTTIAILIDVNSSKVLGRKDNLIRYLTSMGENFQFLPMYTFWLNTTWWVKWFCAFVKYELRALRKADKYISKVQCKLELDDSESRSILFAKCQMYTAAAYITRIHTQEAPYLCRGCERSYRRSVARKRHWQEDPQCHTEHERKMDTLDLYFCYSLNMGLMSHIHL
jgi:hypothetical protein